MMPDETIKNPSELEFVIFCIENVAEKIRQIMILLWVVLPMIRYSTRWNYFFDGLIDKTEAIRRLQYEKPNLQMCFRTEKALSLLHFEGSEKL